MATFGFKIYLILLQHYLQHLELTVWLIWLVKIDKFSLNN